MYGGLYETILKKSSISFLHIKRSDLFSEKSSVEIAESIRNLVCRLKNEINDVSVLTIILTTDDKKLNKKGMEVNLH